MAGQQSSTARTASIGRHDFRSRGLEALANLVKKVDAETVKNSKAKMGSFVVFLSDSKDMGTRQGLGGQGKRSRPAF